MVQVGGAGAEAVTHCATFTPAESLVAEQASRAFGMMEACEWADLDAPAQQVGLSGAKRRDLVGGGVLQCSRRGGRIGRPVGGEHVAARAES